VEEKIILDKLNAEWKAYLNNNRLELLFKYSHDILEFMNGIEFIDLDGEKYNYAVTFNIYGGTWKFGTYVEDADILEEMSNPNHCNINDYFHSLFEFFDLSEIDIDAYSTRIYFAKIKDKTVLLAASRIGQKIVNVVCENGKIYNVLENGERIQEVVRK
jgi:hypothetical protein